MVHSFDRNSFLIFINPVYLQNNEIISKSVTVNNSSLQKPTDFLSFFTSV